MITVEISFSMIIAINKLISQEGKVCLFSAYECYMSVKYGQIAKPLAPRCGAEPGFQLRAAGNDR